MKSVLLFPGYGSQYVGMAKELYDSYRVVQEYFEEASNCLGSNFVKLCFASSEAEIARIANAYPAIFLVGCSTFAALAQEGIEPDLMAGYNQGLYAALFAAKSINLPDGLYVLAKYASFYQEFLSTLNMRIMLVSGLNTERVATIAEKHAVSIAIFISATNCIVSGAEDAMIKFREEIEQHDDAVVKELPLGVGLHSAVADPVAKQLEMYLEKVDFKAPQRQVVSGISGRLIGSGPEARQQILDEINTAGHWERVLDVLKLYDVIIEVGNGTHLTTIMKKLYPEKHIIGVNTRSDIESIKELFSTQEMKNGID